MAVMTLLEPLQCDGAGDGSGTGAPQGQERRILGV
uniref:Uncharacterized protein n=1 Tax=Arundo donax TaxID=35708 RepID=A0A0A9A053_ARUDO